MSQTIKFSFPVYKDLQQTQLLVSQLIIESKTMNVKEESCHPFAATQTFAYG